MTIKRNGGLCVLEQTILPRRLESDLLADQARILSGWQPGLVAWAEASIQTEREEREWQLADRIVVGSDFVRDGLLQCGVPTGKIAEIPYGVDVRRFSPARRDKRSPGPLRVLFVGEVGLRKGAPWLLKALHRLGPDRVEARFAGTRRPFFHQQDQSDVLKRERER